MKIKSFTKEDWMGLAGAEGDDPKVVYHSNLEGGWTAVADANGIFVGVYKENSNFDDYVEDYWSHNCNQDFAEFILKNANPDEFFSREAMKKFGFEKC